MASGSFHDSSSHSGSFHSSGGSSGRSSGSSSGSSGGYSGSYTDGSDFDYVDGIDDDIGTGIGIAGVILFFLSFPIMILMSIVGLLVYLPRATLLTLGIFFVSGIVFIPSIKNSKRLSELNYIKRKDVFVSDGRVSSAKNGENRIGDRFTWYSKEKRKKTYAISFDELERSSRFDDDEAYGSYNVMAVKETIKRTPKIIWISPGKWYLFSFICFVCNIFFYELVIPIFENIKMSDSAFIFFDNLIFFLPSCLALLFSILSIIFIFVKDKLLYECAVRIVEDKKAKEEAKMSEQSIASRLSLKWYYNICPNCGANADRSKSTCQNCGSSLEVISMNKGIGAIHKIPREAEK